MNGVLNNLFDDFGEFFGKKKTLDEQIAEALKGKKINRTEFEKDGITTITESYSDSNITYHSQKFFVKENKIIVTESNENISSLAKQMNLAIAREEYEIAAKLRDKISKLKNNYGEQKH